MAKTILELDVLERINGVMTEMGKVGKDGNVSFRSTNYNYTSEAAFIAAVRPLMLRYKLVMAPTNVEYQPNAGQYCRLVVTYTIYAAGYEGGGQESLQVQAAGMGAESDDKAVYKALTGAFKYALRQSFMVASGDDNEKTDTKGNPTDKPSPFTQLRTNLGKAGIVVAKSSTPTELDLTNNRNKVIGGVLYNVLNNAGIDVTKDDHDTLQNAIAINTFLKTTRTAANLQNIREAAEALTEALK